jgi:hypothetical protein
VENGPQTVDEPVDNPARYVDDRPLSVDERPLSVDGENHHI